MTNRDGNKEDAPELSALALGDIVVVLVDKADLDRRAKKTDRAVSLLRGANRRQMGRWRGLRETETLEVSKHQSVRGASEKGIEKG